MISIVTVNWNAYDFAQLLIDSASWYTDNKYEIIVVDNSVDIQPLKKVIHLPQSYNIGHGQGLNIGCQAAKYPYTLFLDIDCHFLMYDWVEAFMGAIGSLDVLAGKGVPAKPVRPACMLLKTEVARKYNWSSTPGYKGHRVTPEGYDVAIAAYHQMVDDKLAIGFMESKSNRYETLNGEEWLLDGISYVYHHWHGTHLTERAVDFPGKDLIADKEAFFDKIRAL